MKEKEIIIKNTKNKFNKELLDIVLKQINTYEELSNSNYQANSSYKTGDEVYLTTNHLLHGIGTHTEYLETISKRGIVSQDYFGVSSNHAFCYEAAFWTVKRNVSLRDYIINYSGIIAKVNDKYEQIPYGKLDLFVEKMKEVDHWLWTAESSMEIRFMPSLARNINQVGFILNMENPLAKELRKNSIFKNEFKKEYAFEFVNDKAKDKFYKEGFISDFFYRADYLIFGVPYCCIEGIIVGRQIENSKEYLNHIKSLFKNCYICNLDGKVIVE